VLAASSAGAAEPLLTSPGLAFPARVDGLRTSPGLPVAADGLRRPTEACNVAPSIFSLGTNFELCTQIQSSWLKSIFASHVFAVEPGSADVVGSPAVCRRVQVRGPSAGIVPPRGSQRRALLLDRSSP
jgi:hypothetical protein